MAFAPCGDAEKSAKGASHEFIIKAGCPPASKKIIAKRRRLLKIQNRYEDANGFD
jgi:hypothetical protein